MRMTKFRVNMTYKIRGSLEKTRLRLINKAQDTKQRI